MGVGLGVGVGVGFRLSADVGVGVGVGVGMGVGVGVGVGVGMGVAGQGVLQESGQRVAQSDEIEHMDMTLQNLQNSLEPVSGQVCSS